MKRLLIILGVLVALTVAGGGATALLVDWSAVRAAALARLGSATGLAIAIDGGVDVALWPQLAVRVTGVRLAPVEAGEGHTIAAAETLDLVPSIAPLFRGEVAFEQIVLAGVSVNLERDATGRGNWEALAAQLGGGAGEQPIAMRVERGTLFYADRRDGSEAVVAGIAGKFSSGPDGLRVDGRFDFRGLPFTAVGALATAASDGGAPFDLTVRMDRRISVTAAGRLANGMVDGGRLKIEAADLPAAVKRISPTVVVPGVFKDLAVEGRFGFARSTLQLDELRLRAGTLVVGGKATLALGGQKPAFDAVLNVSTLPVDPLIDFALTLPPGSGGGAVDGHVVLAVDAAIYRSSAVRGLKVAARLHDGAITVERAEGVAPGNTRIVFDGQAAPRGGQAVFEGSVKGQADDLRSFLAWLGVDLGGIPEERFRRAEVESSLRLDDWHLILDGFRFKVDAIEVSGKFAMPWRGQAPIGVVLDIDQLDLDAYAGAVGGDAKPGRSLDGQITVGRLTVADRRLDNVRADAIWNGVEAKVRHVGFLLPGQTTFAGEGRLLVAGGKPRFLGQVEGQSEQPAELARWLGFTPGPGLLGRHHFAYRAEADLALDKLSASSLSVRFDDSTLTGSISAATEAGRPKIVADVKVDQWAVPLPDKPDDAAAAGPYAWSSDRLDFSWLSGFDLDLTAGADRLRADKYTLEAVRMEARVRERRIGVEWLEGKGYGGEVRARGFLDAAGDAPRYLARVEFAGIDLGPLLVAAAEYGDLDGKGSLYAELSGRAGSQSEVITSSVGTVKISGGNGTFEGIDVDLVGNRLRDLQNIGDIGPLLNATEAGGQTRIQRIGADWTLGGGVAKTENLRVDMRTAILEARGSIDVGSLTLDIRGDLTFTAAAGQPHLGVLIRGPLAAPVRELKTGGLKDYIQKRINDHGMGKAEPPPPIGDVLPESIELPQLTRRQPRP